MMTRNVQFRGRITAGYIFTSGNIENIFDGNIPQSNVYMRPMNPIRKEHRHEER